MARLAPSTREHGNYLGEDLGGCSVRMDELEAGWLQVSEVGEAGCHQEERVLSNATTETKTAIFL